MHVRAERLDELGHVGDVVVEMKRARGDRHQPRVDPVGDPDVVIRQQRTHGVAQQCRVVARQRRDDQHARIGRPLQFRRYQPLEMQQAAERLVDLDFLDDRHLDIADVCGLEPELRLFILLADPVQQVVAGGQAPRQRRVGEGAVGTGKEFRSRLRPHREWVQETALQFMQVIKHAWLRSFAAVALRGFLRKRQPIVSQIGQTDSCARVRARQALCAGRWRRTRRSAGAGSRVSARADDACRARPSTRRRRADEPSFE